MEVYGRAECVVESACAGAGVQRAERPLVDCVIGGLVCGVVVGAGVAVEVARR